MKTKLFTVLLLSSLAVSANAEVQQSAENQDMKNKMQEIMNQYNIKITPEMLQEHQAKVEEMMNKSLTKLKESEKFKELSQLQEVENLMATYEKLMSTEIKNEDIKKMMENLKQLIESKYSSALQQYNSNESFSSLDQKQLVEFFNKALPEGSQLPTDGNLTANIAQQSYEILKNKQISDPQLAQWKEKLEQMIEKSPLITKTN